MKQSALIYVSKDSREFPKDWAVDHGRNFYMYFAPIIVCPEDMGSLLYFFFQGILYSIRMESPFGSQVIIMESLPMSIRDELEKEISDAFAVFGRSGGGGSDCLGHPDSFVPEFKKER